MRKVGYYFQMFISQKSQYALRATFELARHHDQGWTKIAQIAQTQAIPPRFLEVILNQLKQAGFIRSKRGSDGGYMLTRPPDQLTVGDVLCFMEGPIGPVECIAGAAKNPCPLFGKCPFLSLWKTVNRSISKIYNDTTLQDLLDQNVQENEPYVPCYNI